MDFCVNWELEEKARSFEMKARLDQMDAIANYTVHYADNTAVETMTWQHESKSKIDIFEAMNLLIFPYDPIRDYTKREIEKINERFRKVESLLGL